MIISKLTGAKKQEELKYLRQMNANYANKPVGWAQKNTELSQKIAELHGKGAVV